VGKTYLLGSYAAELLESGEIEQVIVTRPAVEAGESLGFLPGELDEKFGPFLKPFRDVMIERLGANDYKGKVKSDRISPQPLSHMRGSTFKNALMILDEAQNCKVEQVKMFLTRIGEGSRIVMNGDPEQCDLHEPSGLVDALRRFRDTPGFQIIEFAEDDCVRHDIIKHILRGYRRKL